MVEHNLAKVGVASSSLVFRSMPAQVAELVDAHVSGACVERRAGSTPVLGTSIKSGIHLNIGFFVAPPAAMTNFAIKRELSTDAGVSAESSLFFIVKREHARRSQDDAVGLRR